MCENVAQWMESSLKLVNINVAVFINNNKKKIIIMFWLILTPPTFHSAFFFGLFDFDSRQTVDRQEAG